MRKYKKRTIALVLASAITVVGSFAEENYKNSLMSLEFKNEFTNSIDMVLHTKNNYDNPINIRKQDINTFVIMLPETNCDNNVKPKISGNISSVDIKTIPYTTNGKGYTKITVKTVPNTALTASKTIYVPSETPPKAIIDNNKKPLENDQINSQPAQIQQTKVEQNERPKQNVQLTSVNNNLPQNNSDSAPNINKSLQQFKTNTDTINNSSQISVDQYEEPKSVWEQLFIILAFIAVISTVAFLYTRGVNKLNEVLGESLDIDLKDDTKPNKKEKESTKRAEIKSKIKALDKMYSNPTRISEEKYKSQTDIKQSSEPIEQEVVVDLDELFQKKLTNNKSKPSVEQENYDDNSDALDDFLSEFSFPEENEIQDLEEDTSVESAFDEELYEKCIKEDIDITFSSDDVDKIEMLLNTEISDEAISDLSKTMVTNPIKKQPSKKEVLENLITTYAINQDITFTKDDVETLNKLICIELDKDFITDLRTNPQKYVEMRKEIELHKNRAHKTNEILILNVKDILPNLSEELKKQGDKPIEIVNRSEVVYYKEGYDVNILSTDDLPDLATELKDKDATKYRPSDGWEYTDSNFNDVQKFSTDGLLPDLKDVMEHPNKYKEKAEKPAKVDEKALLNNISNVTFKPFFDETKDIEILNKDEPESNSEEITLSMDDVKEDLERFNNLIQVSPSENENPATENIVEKEETIIDKQDEDKEKEKERYENKKINDAKALIELIEKIQDKKEKRATQEPKLDKKNQNTLSPKSGDRIGENIVIDNQTFEIVAESKFVDKVGCLLAKSDQEYAVIGFIGDKMFKIKHYEKLETENIQSRLSETLSDGNVRYLIRIGIHKFILNVNNSNMEFIMDLC